MTDEPDFPPRLPTFAYDPQPWADDAVCRQTDPELYFPGHGAHGKDTRSAASLCVTCTVRVDCLQYALDAEEPLYGIWGGTTEQQRREWRRDGTNALDALYPIDEEEAS